jgi:hypothetical protein
MNIALAFIPPTWGVFVALFMLVASAAITGKIIKF